MSDDLIRRGDVLREIANEGLHILDAAIAAIPARGVGVKPDRATFDAMCAMRNSINEYIPMPSLESDLLQGPENSVFCATVAQAVISEVSRLRGIISGTVVKQLEWHNFDAWTHWAEGACGTYHVEERNGYWQAELRVGGLVHGVTDTGDTTPEDLYAAKAAAQADYEARILAALSPAPHVNETQKSEHEGADVLTDATQAPAEDAHVKGETAGQMLERLGMDGVKWAAEFRTTALRLGYSDMDEGWLIGWFCNAIMAGCDRSAAQAREAALREAHKAILAMDTKKDEDLTYNLAVLRAAEKVRRLISEART